MINAEVHLNQQIFLFKSKKNRRFLLSRKTISIIKRTIVINSTLSLTKDYRKIMKYKNLIFQTSILDHQLNPL
jgi:hypothetical protein